MDDHLSKLQLWEAEKNLILYFYEINAYYELIKSDLEDYDQEDMEILAMDISNALIAISDKMYLGIYDSDDHTTVDQVIQYVSAIRRHIIENSDIGFATDIVESVPNFTPVQDFITKYTDGSGNNIHSYYVMDEIKKITYDIMAWAELYYVHRGLDIHTELSSRSNTVVNIITHDPDLDDSPVIGKDSIDSTKAFRSYFIKDFDAKKIATINGRINDLGKQKKENYVSKLAALTAVLYENKVLSKTYKATLTYLFDRFGIKEAPATYKPAQFKRPSMKGTVPAAWTEAVEYFNSL